MNEINFINCMQDTSLGGIVITLFVYGMLTTILIIILLWIIKNQFNKNKGVEE